MNEILRRKYSRNAFFAAMALFIALVLVVRYVVVPYFSPAVDTGYGILFANVLNGLITSSLVTVTIGSFMFWIQPRSMSNAKIEIENQDALGELFDAAFRKTDIWYYKGGCGRFFRTKSLTEVASWARKKSQSREILVVILDPTNTETCKKHALYRSGTASQKVEKERWDQTRVQAELYATVVTTLVTQFKEPLLRLTLSLCNHYSSFRIDLCDDYAIITKEDRTAPAIICQKDTYFYKSYKDEVILSLNQSRIVSKIEQADFDLSKISVDQVKSVLTQAGFADAVAGLSPEFWTKVAILCQKQENPYA